jgi:hypothetical protein
MKHMVDIVTLPRSMDLLPVLELAPWHYARPDRASPGTVDPDVFHEYWKASLEDASIVGLEPVDRGSWFVALESLDAPALLRPIIAHWFEENAEDLHENHDEALASASALSGGALLRCDGRTIVRPNCCSDLGSLDAWSEAARHREPDWAMLWIGHPWISVRFEDGHLVLSEAHEGGRPIEKYRVDPSAIDEAHARAVLVRAAFAERLGSVLNERLRPADASRLSARLAGISE